MDIKISKATSWFIIVSFIALGIVLGLIGLLPTMVQGVFVAITFFCILQNIALIRFNLMGKAENYIKAIFNKIGFLAKTMNTLRMVALMAMILERPLLQIETQFNDFQIVFYIIVLNLATQLLAQTTAGKAIARNPESAVYIANMTVEAKQEAVKELESALVAEINEKLTVKLSDEDSQELLKVLTENADKSKILHKLHLLKKV